MPRQRNYAAEYQARKARAASSGVTYSQARRLRELFPVSRASERQLQRNRAEIRARGKTLAQMRTDYAVIRARLAAVEEHNGQRLSRAQQAALRIRAPYLRAPGDAYVELAQWYQDAWGDQYRASDFPGVPVGPGVGEAVEPGAPGFIGGMATAEDLYNIDVDYPDEWEEFAELWEWPDTP